MKLILRILLNIAIYLFVVAIVTYQLIFEIFNKPYIFKENINSHLILITIIVISIIFIVRYTKRD